MQPLSPAEFKALYDSTPNRNKMLKSERATLNILLRKNTIAYIYSGGRHLNVIGQRPNYNKPRFVIRPKVKEIVW